MLSGCVTAVEVVGGETVQRGSARIGEAGMALIGMLVAEMGFVWHPRRVDHGIDGEVELVSPDGAALNRVLLVQSEATERRFAGEGDDGFWWVCDESDRPHGSTRSPR
jgi:hypothetical protein